MKILTYNVHSCIGTDRKLDIDRIAASIAETGADIIGLQELDVGRARTGGVDQAHAIAKKLRMDAHFHPALHVREERYGDAVLTALPMRLVRAAPLPSIGEPRGALWVEIDAHGTTLQLINTHFGLGRRERSLQVRTLLGPEWLGNPDFADAHRLLIGDFNSIPSSPAYRQLAAVLSDVQPPGKRHRATFHARFPIFRLDHIFASPGLTCTHAQVIETPLARRASDHLPLVATFALPEDLPREQNRSLEVNSGIFQEGTPMQHLDQADGTGKLDIGGTLSDTPYHLTTKSDDGSYRVEITVSAPRDWLLQRGFSKQATLRRDNGDDVTLLAEKALDVDGPISVVLTSEATVCSSKDDMLAKFPELKN